MSNALPKYHRRRILLVGCVTAALLVGLVAGSAMAEGAVADGADGPPRTVRCPESAPALPAAPAPARAADRDPALPDARTGRPERGPAASVGKSGPASPRKAAPGPPEDEHRVTINRMATVPWRTAKEPHLSGDLSRCALAP
ncbi:hypothetical protein [Streptomyces sp. SP18CS02]|uniref:hypothetical protein n=1 Tax=Streptomyces sp. SP18CS02 TaxID=3002531 RepID=UPI002E7A5A85|nr:hypothetical protein [Streptomyces sp. SP18CS02]MEE1754645.1 hypothetical protein [Streptomyces sp. SP18CS02]